MWALRALGAAVVAIDAFGGLRVTERWGLALDAGAFLVGMVAMVFPRVGFIVVLGLVWLALVQPDEVSLWQVPLMINLAAISGSRPWRTTLLALSAYVTAGFLIFPDVGDLVIFIAFLIMLVFGGRWVGWLIRRQERSEITIEQLVDDIESIHREERHALADELSRLMSGDLERQHQAMATAPSMADPMQIRTVLATVDAQSRAALARVRRLVQNLRSPVETAPPSWLEGIEALEDELASQAYLVELDLDPALDDLPIPDGELLPMVADHLQDHALPGGRCAIIGRVSDDTVLVRIGHEVAEEASRDVWPGLVQRLSTPGCRVSVDGDDGWWQVQIEHHDVTPAVPPRPASPQRPLAILASRWEAFHQTDVPWQIGIQVVGFGLLILSLAHLVSLRVVTVTSLLWVATTVTIITATAFPRATTIALALLLIIGSALPPRPLPSAPMVQVMILTVLVLAWRPRWALLPALGWLAFAIIKFPERTTAEAIVTTALMAIPTVALGLLASYFLASHSHQHRAILRLEQERGEARTQERQALAGELHDMVAHQLTSMSWEISHHGDSTDLVDLRATALRISGLLLAARNDLTSLVFLMRGVTTTSPEGTWSTPSATARAVANTLHRTGFFVDVCLDPDIDDCDSATAHTIARILRESGTNIMRYSSPGGACVITITAAQDRIDLDIVSPLAAVTPSHPDSTGNGLGGLAERAQLTGATFWAGRVEHQWRVISQLPRHPLSTAPAGV